MKNEVMRMLDSGEIQMTEDVACMAGTIRMVLSNAKDEHDTETRVSLADAAIEILDAWIESMHTGTGHLPPMSDKTQKILAGIINASKPLIQACKSA